MPNLDKSNLISATLFHGLAQDKEGDMVRFAVLLLLATAAHADDRLERSRTIAADSQQTLGGELKAAVADGGPVRAIEVCADVAPRIAARFSAESGGR